ncbi:MAG: hypothetical protein GXY44_07085 [Phycisphaerales bacterium]|nr:hypothetical protein [Phycisphaerales bacterium]
MLRAAALCLIVTDSFRADRTSSGSGTVATILRIGFALDIFGDSMPFFTDLDFSGFIEDAGFFNEAFFAITGFVTVAFLTDLRFTPAVLAIEAFLGLAGVPLDRLL